MLPISRNVFRCDLRGLYLGQLIVSTFHYAHIPGDISNDLLTQFLHDFVVQVLPKMAACNVDTMVWTHATLSRHVINRDNYYSTREDFTATPGVIALPGLPSAIAATITRAQNLNQKAFRGRLYVPAIATAHVSEGQVQTGSATWTALGQLANVMKQTLFAQLTPEIGFYLRPVVARLRRAAASGDLFPAAPIAETRANRVLRRLRSRQPGFGR